jgi:hypothetical protein
VALFFWARVRNPIVRLRSRRRTTGEFPVELRQ